MLDDGVLPAERLCAERLEVLVRDGEGDEWHDCPHRRQRTISGSMWMACDGPRELTLSSLVTCASKVVSASNKLRKEDRRTVVLHEGVEEFGFVFGGGGLLELHDDFDGVRQQFHLGHPGG